MCRPASMVVTKQKVFWSKNSDSHEDIIEEFKLDEGKLREQPKLVRVEIVPPNEDYKLPFSKWNYRLDQDIKPKWYDEKKVEARVRKHLKEWRKCKVVMPNEEKREIKTGNIVAIYGTVKYIRGGTVEYIDGGIVEYIDGGTVEYIYGGTVEYMRGGTVECIRGGTVEYIYGGTVKYIHGGTVKYIDGGTVKYIRGGTVKYIRGGTVECIYGGTVKYIDGKLPSELKGSVLITTYKHLSPKILKSSQAVMIDRSGAKVKCYVGKDE